MQSHPVRGELEVAAAAALPASILPLPHNHRQDLLQEVMLACLCVQWTLGELACYTYSLVSVPLYDTLGTEAIVYIIEKGRAAGLDIWPAL